MVSSSSVEFDSSSNMTECITVIARNDSNFESAENFFLQLMSTSSPFVLVDSTHSAATFTILDIDGEAMHQPVCMYTALHP